MVARGLCSSCYRVWHYHHRQTGIRRECEICGKKFFVPPSRATQRSCSTACARKLVVPHPKTSALEVPCQNCGKLYWTNPSLIARGKVFCSWGCYLEGKNREHQKKIKDRKCANDDCDRTDICARGLCNACYQRWNLRFGKSAKWIEKTCPVCGATFYTFSDRTYCSRECYVKSDVFRLARKEFAEKMIRQRLESTCLQCGKVMSFIRALGRVYVRPTGKKSNPKKFCSRSCARLFFAARFDRASAAYPLIECPESYDEFLSQERLPCLVEGCDWFGKHLSIHINHAHGITASQLKAWAGFNRSTGVVCLSTLQALEARPSHGLANFDELSDPEAIRRCRGPMRPEGREHQAKGMALWRASREKVEPLFPESP